MKREAATQSEFGWRHYLFGSNMVSFLIHFALISLLVSGAFVALVLYLEGP